MSLTIFVASAYFMIINNYYQNIASSVSDYFVIYGDVHNMIHTSYTIFQKFGEYDHQNLHTVN